MLDAATNPHMLSNTLDEPVTETIKRDLIAIGIKLKYVMIPRMSEDDTLKELRKWDLWGPLLLCMLLSVILSLTAPKGQASLVFASVFLIVWGGAGIVTLNAQLLGGNVSFFQSVCVLGYSIFPIVLSSMLCLISDNHIYRFIIVTIAFLWSTRASVVFMSQLVNPERKGLAAFPVFLFYLVLSWMVLVL